MADNVSKLYMITKECHICINIYALCKRGSLMTILPSGYSQAEKMWKYSNENKKKHIVKNFQAKALLYELFCFEFVLMKSEIN